MKAEPPYVRMMRRVRITETCWLFEGALDQNGHGNVAIMRNGKRTCDKAHRVSYRHHKGEIPEGLLVRHMCDVRNCVNPEHLETGTHKENMGDIIARNRGRNQYGTWVGKAAVADATDDCPF